MPAGDLLVMTAITANLYLPAQKSLPRNGGTMENQAEKIRDQFIHLRDQLKRKGKFRVDSKMFQFRDRDYI